MSRHGDDFNEAAEGDKRATAQNACDVLTAFAIKIRTPDQYAASPERPSAIGQYRRWVEWMRSQRIVTLAMDFLTPRRSIRLLT